ncbi:response regulator, partial [Acinetobacter baumannii]
ERPLVLVADDNADAQLIYAECFRTLGYRFVSAYDGRTAIDQARAIAPDIIVMDLAMPELDGLEATRILKSDPATRQ